VTGHAGVVMLFLSVWGISVIHVAYANDFLLIGKNEIVIRQLFCRNGKHCHKARTTDK
jgi:hypothetical protein